MHFEPSDLKSNLVKLVVLLSIISANLEAPPRVLLRLVPLMLAKLWLRFPNTGEELGSGICCLV